MAINLVILQGNVGRAPELQHTTSGTPVAKFGLATTDRMTELMQTITFKEESFRQTK